MSVKNGELLDTTDLHYALTAKALEAQHRFESAKKLESNQHRYFEGYSAALEWVRDELLELEDPAVTEVKT